MPTGATLVVFSVRDAEFPAANAPGAGVITLRNRRPKLDFDPTTDETCYFEFSIPRHYNGGGITIKFPVASTATTGTSRWEMALERVTGQDTNADSFATAQSIGVVTNATAGILTEGTISLASGAGMDSAVAGERVRLLVRRDADATTGLDSLAVDAELLSGIEILET